MKIPSRILTGAALFAAVLSPSFAQTATTKPVGYRTETVKAGVFNLLSSNLDNPVGAAGTIDTIAGATLTDNEANYTAAFTAGEPITLKITDGANAGITQDVTAFTAKTLTTAQDISALLAAGVKYEVRKTPTVASTFGATNTAGLAQGTATSADVLWIPNGAGGYTRVYRSAGGLSGVGWRKVGGGSADAASEAISITDAIFIERRGAADLPNDRDQDRRHQRLQSSEPRHPSRSDSDRQPTPDRNYPRHLNGRGHHLESKWCGWI
jgi:hypothetical protein